MNPSQPLTKPLARYVHTRRVGDLLFVAGQGCRNPADDQCVGLRRDASGQIVGHDIAEQTRGVFANINRVLEAEGLTRADLVDITVFLKSMADFPAMNQVWNEYFAGLPTPTRTTVAVADLPGDNFVEMKAIAAFGPSRG
jgi:reactive intermediate/imine deaminase